MPDSVAPQPQKQIRLYDFQRDEAMDRSRLRRLSPVLEVAAHRIAQSLSSMVRSSVRVDVGELEQKRWELWANSLPEPTFLATASVTPVGGRLAIHAPLALAQTVVELRLGGSMSGVVLERALSDIELRLFMEAAESILGEMFEAMKVVVPMKVGQLSASSSPMLVQVPNPAETSLLVNLKLTIEEQTEFETVVCLPLSVLMALLDTLERVDMANSGEPDAVITQLRERLLDAPVEVSVSFPEIVLSTDELLTLAVGDVISLQRPEGLPLRLNVGHIHYCDVVPTTNGKRLACMVVEPLLKEDR